MRKRRVERAATPNSFPPPPAPTTTDNKSNLQQGRSGRLRSTLLFRPTLQQQSLPLVQDGRFPLAPSSFSTTRACLARLPPCSSSSAVCPPLPLLTFSLPPIVLLGRCAPSRLLARSLPVLTVPLLPLSNVLFSAPARRSSSFGRRPLISPPNRSDSLPYSLTSSRRRRCRPPRQPHSFSHLRLTIRRRLPRPPTRNSWLLLRPQGRGLMAWTGATWSKGQRG